MYVRECSWDQHLGKGREAREEVDRGGQKRGGKEAGLGLGRAQAGTQAQWKPQQTCRELSR